MKIMKKLLSATIASITLLSSATSIGTFSASAANTRYKTTNTMGLEFEIENNYAVLKKCTSSASVITVPQTIYYKSGNNNWTLPVKKIDSNAFLNKKSLYEINLPNGLQTIESDAFYGCSNLRKAIIPYTVTSCKKIKIKDTHGGFHGDGVIFAILDCSQSNETIINQIKEWDTLPITDESILSQFKRFQLDDFYNDEVKNYDILNKQNGFYYFKGKNQYDYGYYANFDLAIYDSDNFIFYYFEYDS